MKLGFFTQPVHPITRDYREVLREDQQAIILADELGYSEAFVGEHMTDLAEPITNCLVFLATLIDKTKTIRLGSGVVNLPSYHPVQIAAHIAMLDHMLNGRFIFGIGPGGLPSDVEVFGNLDLDKNEKMVESIDQILSIWTGNAPYNIEGKYFKTSTERTFYPEIGQGIIPKPLQKPHPEIVFTALAPYSKGITAAAERGWRGISSNYVNPHWVATHIPKFLEGLSNAGLPEEPGKWSIAKSIFISEDEQVAINYAKSESGPYGFYFQNIMKKIKRGRGSQGLALFKSYPDQPEEELTVQHSLDKGVIAGTVNSVVDQILALRELVGPFGTLMYTGHDWADIPLSRRSMELMASEVMPKVNKALDE
jgi:alkanesulfonate monooxygenase SsuD/methylene tetrahydromethanopterin reductase-like flavin-dependent oxidoreductase (luciferase family)|tara:strand:- start:350 stop:1447 length:1098 start_codon:yes stop_codon:yes gene_type:complete